MLLIIGAGYVGAKLAELALAEGYEVVVADNWYATRREQLATVEAAGGVVETADIRHGHEVYRLLAREPERVYLLAAQASRPLSWEDPDYTEETNVTGARRVGEAVAAAGGPPLVYASSLHVYGPDARGDVGAEHPYGPQADLSHLSKIYAEQCLMLLAHRHEFAFCVLRLGIVYGPSPVEHERPESQTVVDRFRRLAAAGRELPLDDGGRAAIGVVHVEDAARILLDAPYRDGVTVANVAAETLTVSDIARLARGEPAEGAAPRRYTSEFAYRHAVADYLRR